MKYSKMASGSGKRTRTVKVNPHLIKKNIKKNLNQFKFKDLSKQVTMKDGQREPRMNDSEPGGLISDMKKQIKRVAKKKSTPGKKLHRLKKKM